MYTVGHWVVTFFAKFNVRCSTRKWTTNWRSERTFLFECQIPLDVSTTLEARQSRCDSWQGLVAVYVFSEIYLDFNEYVVRFLPYHNQAPRYWECIQANICASCV